MTESASMMARASDRDCIPNEIIGSHPSITALTRQIDQVARLSMTVLVLGQTGVGKELVVNRVHARSGRKGPLVCVNVAALPEQLIESELFGAMRGAYTGATTDRRGLIEASAHGTLSLDEATDLPRTVQAKLLRVLETGRVRPIGGLSDRTAEFRLVISVQQSPADLVASGRWREDFYYRVAGVCLTVPSLAERTSDIPTLVNHFLACLGRPPITLDALTDLARHPWPGNVRQLRRTVERALFLAGSQSVTEGHLIDAMREWRFSAEPLKSECGQWTPCTLRMAERAHIERMLAAFEGDVAAASSALGLSASQLYRRMQREGIRLANRRRLRRCANDFAQLRETSEPAADIHGRK